VLGQLSLSLSLWSTAHRRPWDTLQQWSSPLRKVEPEAMGHVIAPKLTSARRRGPKPRDAWQRRCSPQQGVEVRGLGTCGSDEAHLSKEARFRAVRHVTAPKLTSSRRQGLELRDTWQRRSSPHQGGEVQIHGTRGDVEAHLYMKV
jgi:hypothetical protein